MKAITRTEGEIVLIHECNHPQQDVYKLKTD